MRLIAFLLLLTVCFPTIAHAQQELFGGQEEEEKPQKYINPYDDKFKPGKPRLSNEPSLFSNSYYEIEIIPDPQ
ncbi:MAG: hypothetical protein ACPGRX_05915, partial [Bdellovibrionales bacterium]